MNSNYGQLTRLILVYILLTQIISLDAMCGRRRVAVVPADPENQLLALDQRRQNACIGMRCGAIGMYCSGLALAILGAEYGINNAWSVSTTTWATTGTIFGLSTGLCITSLYCRQRNNDALNRLAVVTRLRLPRN